MPDSPKRSNPLVWIWLSLMGMPFLAAGVFALVKVERAPQMDWAILAFGILFGGFGAALVVAGPIVVVKMRRLGAKEAEAPDQPWRWRDDWASGRIAGTAGNAGGVPSLLGPFWLAFSAPLAWFIFHKADMPVFGRAIFGLGFPIIGVLLLVGSILGIMRRRRFGKSWLTLDAVPAPPGGALSGRIDCGVPDQLDPTFHLVLHCTETWTEPGRGNRSSTTRSEDLWRDEYDCVGERSAEASDGSQIAVRFDLPAAMPATGKGTRGDIAWRVVATSELSGVDYRDGFEVPVFPLPAGMTQPAPRARPDAAKGRLSTGRLELVSEGFETRLTFPPAMNPGLATVPTVLLILSGYLCLAYASAGTWFGAIPSGVLAALMLWAASRAWLMRTRVTVRRGEIEVERTMLVAWRRLAWRADEATGFETVSNFSSGDQAWYQLSIAGGRKASLGSLIDSQATAERVRDALNERFRS
jgi:hypothetical protein